MLLYCENVLFLYQFREQPFQNLAIIKLIAGP